VPPTDRRLSADQTLSGARSQLIAACQKASCKSRRHGVLLSISSLHNHSKEAKAYPAHMHKVEESNDIPTLTF